jgi:hypothetical protein
MDFDKNDLKKMLSGSKVNYINREKMKEIRAAIEEKLEAVSAIYGINISIDRIKFTQLEFNASVKGIINSTMDGISGEEANFKNSIFRLQFKLQAPDWTLLVKYAYGFMVNGYRVYRYNNRARKFHVIAKNENGGQIKMSINYLLNRIKEKNVK